MTAIDAHLVARRLAVLPDRGMRAAKLLEIVRVATPSAAAWLFDALATAGRAGGPAFDLGLQAAVDLAGDDRLDYELRRAIFIAADESGLAACRELLLSTQTEEAARGAGAPRPLVPGSRPLTLGERKALARSWRRDVIERLLSDPHTDVVALLLANPHITEDDVLRIATARRSSAAVLELVLRSRRFGPRPGVRRALVRNPRLPLSWALRLLGLLNDTELREMAADPSLRPALATALARRLRPVM